MVRMLLAVRDRELSSNQVPLVASLANKAARASTESRLANKTQTYPAARTTNRQSTLCLMPVARPFAFRRAAREPVRLMADLETAACMSEIDYAAARLSLVPCHWQTLTEFRFCKSR